MSRDPGSGGDYLNQMWPYFLGTFAVITVFSFWDVFRGDPDEAFRAKSEDEIYGHRVTRYYHRPFILLGDGKEVWKTREWPNKEMDRRWTGTLCNVYRMPLTREGYEKCSAEEWPGSSARL